MTLINGVEPEGNLGQFDRHRVAVHTVDAVVSEICFHLLLFQQVILMPNDPTHLALFAFQICVGQLIDGFIQERAAA